MARKHRQPALPEPAPPAPPVDARWAARGRLAILVWYGGGFVLLMAGVLAQAGPFGWLAAWQVRHWGGDTLIVTVLPAFVLIAAPVVILQMLPRHPDRPFLLGAQDAIAPGRNTAIQPPTPARMAQVLLACARGGFAAAGLFLAAGGMGFELIQRIGNEGAGQPLPELGLAAVATPGAVLPPYARLVGVVAQPDHAWTHDHAVRQTRYSDRYVPLTDPGWGPGDAVTLLEEDRSVVGDPVDNWSGPVEGALARDAMPDWMADDMRRSGLALAAHPVVLTRLALGGATPGADMIAAGLVGIGGVMFAVLSCIAALGWLYRRRKLLRRLA